MPTRPDPRPSARRPEPPAGSAPWWIACGLVAVLVAGVLLAVVAATVPMIVAEAQTGDQAIAPMWPLLAILVLGAGGVGAIAHGRWLQARDRLHAARVTRMRQALQDPATTGVSPGIAGTSSIPQAPFH